MYELQATNVSMFAIDHWPLRVSVQSFQMIQFSIFLIGLVSPNSNDISLDCSPLISLLAKPDQSFADSSWDSCRFCQLSLFFSIQPIGAEPLCCVLSKIGESSSCACTSSRANWLGCRIGVVAPEASVAPVQWFIVEDISPGTFVVLVSIELCSLSAFGSSARPSNTAVRAGKRRLLVVNTHKQTLACDVYSITKSYQSINRYDWNKLPVRERLNDVSALLLSESFASRVPMAGISALCLSNKWSRFDDAPSAKGVRRSWMNALFLSHNVLILVVLTNHSKTTQRT